MFGTLSTLQNVFTEAYDYALHVGVCASCAVMYRSNHAAVDAEVPISPYSQAQYARLYYLNDTIDKLRPGNQETS